MTEFDKFSRTDIMTPEEVAWYLRKSPSWVYKHWQILGGVKLGGSFFFPRRRSSMSVYSVKGKGWRYDFTLKGIRYTEAWFKQNERERRPRKKKGRS